MSIGVPLDVSALDSYVPSPDFMITLNGTTGVVTGYTSQLTWISTGPQLCVNTTLANAGNYTFISSVAESMSAGFDPLRSTSTTLAGKSC